MGFITGSREQQMLFGYSLDDFVDEGAKCRFIANLVSGLDLRELYASYSEQGGDAYDPGLLLGTWFLAYSEGVTSTRRLEELCRRDLHYIYISGNIQPDHCSLSRFRQRHMERLSGYFVEIIRQAGEAGLSEFRLIGIDGSKIGAKSSRHQSMTGEGLEKELRKVREQIREYMERCDVQDEEDEMPEDLGQVRTKIRRLKEQEKRLKRRQRELKSRQSSLQPKDRKKHQINMIEPEARHMRQEKGQSGILGYNVQVSVDTESHLIVGADVTDDPTDQRQFSHQHEQVEINLGPETGRQYVADAGYHSLEQLTYVEEHGVDAVIADPRPGQRCAEKTVGEKQFGRGMFQYDSSTDTYHCPAGKQLIYAWKENNRRRRVRVYQGQACVGCSLRAQCVRSTNPSRLRTINRDEREHLAEAMLAKSRSPDGRLRMVRRRTSNEPVIGNLKENLGFRRFCLRGLKKAKGEFFLMCIGHNLNKLHRLMRELSPHPDGRLARAYHVLTFFHRAMTAFIDSVTQKYPVISCIN